jgi:dolichyl-diphosphooligosaccharide--protein glycosyltransferase
MHNYFASGEARSYTYARERYGPFLSATTGETAWQRLGARRGYVVTTDREGFDRDTVQTRLHQHYGSAAGGVDGLGRYRAVYTSEDGRYRAFKIVPGAVVNGTANANSQLTAVTTVTVSGETIQYRRQVQSGPDGGYSIRVAYSGEYEIGNATVEISSDAVRNGERIVVNES